MKQLTEVNIGDTQLKLFSLVLKFDLNVAINCKERDDVVYRSNVIKSTGVFKAQLKPVTIACP